MFYPNSIDGIKLFLLKFQEQYSQKNIKNLDNLINEFFIDEDDTSMIGSGEKDLFYGINAIKDAIESYWINESKYLSNIELNIDNSKITIEDNCAVAALCGKSIMIIEKEKMYEEMTNKILNNLNESNVSKVELMKISHEISRILYEVSRSNEYIWPFRVSAMLIYDQKSWKFKHINISFGACNGWESWLNSENIDKKHTTIPVKFKSNPEEADVMNTLFKLQDGYINRDIGSIKSLTEDIFVNTKDAFIFGTDEGENFEGNSAASDLLESDFKYWGNFDLNAENAFISINNNMAWVFSKAFLRDDMKSQDTLDSLGDLYHNYIAPSNKSSEEKLLSMLWKTNKRLYDTEFGEIYIVPMKFTAVLIKKNNKWHFLHMHFSDNIDGMPEERLFIKK